jgi:membrane protease YdiL (CAAX protease family)
MKLLTLTPEVEAYAVAGIAVYALACGPLAGYLRSSWPRSPGPPFLVVYVGLMAAVAGAALVVLDLPLVTAHTPVELALALPVGVAIGLLAIWWDAAVRRAARGRARRRGAARDAAWQAGGRPASTHGAALDGARPEAVSTLLVLLAVAALEEVLFRGVLVDLSLSLSPPAAAACLAGTLVLFALSHVYWGWSEVLSKGALGMLALACVLALGTVVPAIVAHAVFNARSWLAVRGEAGLR